MKTIAVEYYKNGDNCAECLIKAARDKFNIKIPEESIKMCKGLSNGLGIGTTCSALEAGVLIFGFFFDERTVLRLRLKLLTLFQSKYRSVYCSKLKKLLKDKKNCECIIGDIAMTIETLINQELKALKSLK